MPIAEILSQGDEVITGQTVDTNAAWLSEQLTEAGFDVRWRVTVSDRLDDIRDAIQQAAGRSDVVVCSGGLGPTDDDLTASAVASAFNAPLQLDEEALAWIEALYARFNRPMPAVNRKQALLPQGSTRLDNHWGTAPGFAVDAVNAWLCFLPGVPREMRAMFTEVVMPVLRRRFALSAARLVTLRTTGVGESNLQQRIGTFQRPGFVLGYRTMLPENHVKLRIAADVPQDEVELVVEELHGLIGSPVFAIEGLEAGDGGSLMKVVARALLANGQTLAVAESCTGGRVASMCTALAGSSEWFIEGCVTYANDSKVRRLGVDPASLQEHGAVSEPVAGQMAAGVRERAGSTFGLATTGIAGPSGGSSDKPVGTVHIALSGPDGLIAHRRLSMGGSRQRIQDLSAAAIIDLLRRHLQGLL